MLRQPTLSSLIAFAAVMRHGTVTAAAQHLFIAQPALSRLISKCEADLGVVLFLRERRRLIPTETAERLLPEVERLLAAHAELPDLAADLSWGGRSMLRIAAAPRLCDGLVGAAIQQLTAEDGGARFVVDSRERTEIERWLATNRYEIGLASLPIAADAVDLVPLGEADSVLILRRDDPLADEEVVSMAALEARRLLLTAPGSLLRERTISAFAGAGKKVTPAIEVGSSPLALRYVAQGLGLFVGDHFSSIGLTDALTTRPIELPFTQRVGFVTPKSRTLPALAEKFMMATRRIAESAGVRLV